MTDDSNELTPISSPPKEAELLGIVFDSAKVAELRRRLVSAVLEAIDPANIKLHDQRISDIYSNEHPLKFNVWDAEVFVKAPELPDHSTANVLVYNHNPDCLESTRVYAEHDWFGHDRQKGMMEVEIVVESDSVQVLSFMKDKQKRIMHTPGGDEIIEQIPLATEASGIFEGRQIKGGRAAFCELVERIIREDVVPPEFERVEYKENIRPNQYLVTTSAAVIDESRDDGRHKGMQSTEAISVRNENLATWREHLQEKLRSLPVSSTGASDTGLKKLSTPQTIYLK